MRAVQRWRYYCEFCKKAGGSKGHMTSHESSCTLNPNRNCKMCTLIDGGNGAALPELLALLPDPDKFMTEHPANEYMDARMELDVEAIKPLIEAALPAMREACQDCPVCLMAALRQKKIPVPIAEGFDYKAEMASMWSDINDSRREY